MNAYLSPVQKQALRERELFDAAEDGRHRSLLPGQSLMSSPLLACGIFATCARTATPRKTLPLRFDLSQDAGGSVEYRGAPLTQTHLRVLLGLLQAAEGKPARAALLSFNAADFLRALGKDDSTRSVEALRSLLADLRSATFVVRAHTKDKGRAFGFVDEVSWDGRAISVRLNPEVPSVLNSLGYSYISLNSRKLLADGLQTLLADLFHSTEGNSYDVSDLARILGRSDVPQVGKDARAALPRLVEAGVIKGWSHTRGRIHIERA